MGRDGSWNLETFTKLREPKRCIKISSKPQGKQQALWPPFRLCKLKKNAVGCIGVVLTFPEFHFALFEFVLDLTSDSTLKGDHGCRIKQKKTATITTN